MNQPTIITRKEKIIGTDGDVIICGRQFFRDVRERRSEWKRDPVALSRGSHKNFYFHFGAIFLHPVENLVYLQKEQAAGYYAVNVSSLPHYSKEIGLKNPRCNGEGVPDEFLVKYAQQIKYRCTVHFSENENEKSLDLNSTYTKKEVIPIEGYEIGLKSSINIPSIRLNGALCQADSNLGAWEIFRVTDEWVRDFMTVYQSAYETNLAPFDYVMPKKSRSIWIPRPKIEAHNRKVSTEPCASHEYKKERSKSLYLMKDEICGAYKIGVSVDPKHREKTLAAEKPSIKMVGMWKDIGSNEKLWHQYFKRQRMRGEWFNLTDHQVRFFTHQCVKGVGPPTMHALSRATLGE